MRMRKRDFLDEIQAKNPKFSITDYRNLANKVGINPSQKELSDEEVDLLTRALAGEDVAATPREASTAIVTSQKEALRDIASLATASKQGAEEQIAYLQEMRDTVAGELAAIAIETISPSAFNASFTQQFALKAREMKQTLQSQGSAPALSGMDLGAIYDIEGEIVD